MLKAESMKTYLSASLLLLLLFSACAPQVNESDPKQLEDSLRKSVSLYYNLLKWKYYDKSYAMVDDEKKEKFDKLSQESKDNLNITSYEIKTLTLEEDMKKAKSKVLVNYYKYPSVSEKAVTVEDAWVFKNGRWFISSDFEGELFN